MNWRLMLSDAVRPPPGSDSTGLVMPGDNVEMKVGMIAPIAVEEGLRFAIREGGRTVGAGRVTKVVK